LAGSLAILAGLAAGCSLIGLGIGAAIDSSHKGPRIVEGWKVESVPTGTKMRVFRRDGSDAAGILNGVETEPEEYRARYGEGPRRRAQADPPVPPSLGDIVTVETAGGRTRSAAFAGFDADSLALQRAGEASTVHVKYQDIVRASTADGSSWSGASLSGLAAE